MKKRILAIACLVGSFAFGQTNIQDARNNYTVGQTVTIRGISANGPNQLGSIRYVQDATGGLPAYGTTLNSVALGDSITVTGVLYDYNGLLEISPTNSFTNHGPKGAPVPLNVSITGTGEPLEGRLLKIDNVTFGQTGNFVANTNYTIQSGGNTHQVRITTGSNLVGTAIPTGPVSVTGLLGQFNADYQLLPRFTADIVAYTPPTREINIKINGTDYLTGGSFFMGNSATATLTIENAGAGNLTVSNTVVTGPQGAEFTTNVPTNTVVGGTSSQNFSINFAPTGNGTRKATLTVNNDDVDESVYVIELEAVGLDNLASEPTANPTNLTFSNVKTYTLNGSYTASATAANYIVLWKNGGGVITALPVDGQTYKRGDVVGDALVTYIGPSTSFLPRGIVANQNYSFKVFGFNGQSGFQNYLTSGPASGTASSLGNGIGTYYSSLNRANPNFVVQLSALINPHTQISYFNYKTTMMPQFEVRDTTDGRSLIVCAYSGERNIFTDPFDWNTTGFSREHTFAHSWMPSYPADNPEKPEYSDQFNLYPVNNNNANSPRSNLPLNDITGSVVYTYLEGRVGYNGNQLVYEPRVSHKGNAARSIMYMAVAYNGVASNNWGIPTNQPQQVLKNWHMADLPDNYEIARNEFIYDLQGNRNPFIDSVDYACSVDFTNISYVNCISSSQLEELLVSNLIIFPVPASKDCFIQVNGTTITEVKITDLQGKLIFMEKVQDLHVFQVNTSNFKSGIYMVETTTPYGKVSGRIIIE